MVLGNPQRVWVPHPVVTKKISHRLAYSPVSWRHFLSQGSLLSNESSLHQIDMKLASTSCRPLTPSQRHPISLGYLQNETNINVVPQAENLGLELLLLPLLFLGTLQITGLQPSELLCSHSGVYTLAPVRLRLCWTVSRRASGDDKDWLWSVQAAGLIPDGPQTPQRSHSHKRTIHMPLLSCCKAITRHVTICLCSPLVGSTH